MTTTEQQAGATEREAVDRLAGFMGWTPMRIPFNYPFSAETDWGKVDFWRTPDGASVALGWNPFTNPADERELLTAVQERWGKVWLVDALDAPEVEVNAVRNWYAFMRNLCAPHSIPWISMGGLVAQMQPGDIARAVDAVLRQFT